MSSYIFVIVENMDDTFDIRLQSSDGQMSWTLVHSLQSFAAAQDTLIEKMTALFEEKA